jgi:indole-3-glycerol phosphate synthase
MSGGFLAEMVAASHRRADRARRAGPLERLSPPPPAGRLLRALTAHQAHGVRAARHSDDAGGRLVVIAEVKRASPSRGVLAPDLDAADQARAYERAGAAAVSVLTEPDSFHGSLDDLRAAADAVDIPVLRKDFLVDPYQVREAAAAGAAAVLLIVAALDDAGLLALLEECAACGLDALVECHDEADVTRALGAGADLIGINNRDLTSLQVDLGTTERLARLAPPDAVLVAESGIRDAADAARMRAAGATALLVGETLVRRPLDELAHFITSLSLAPTSADPSRTPTSANPSRTPTSQPLGPEAHR